MDIIQVTGQEKIKMPTPAKQDPSIAVDGFEKTLKKQQTEQESKALVTKSNDKIEDLSPQDQKLPSAPQNIEDAKTSSLDLLIYDADHQQEGEEENISDMRNDVAVVIPFMSVPFKEHDQNQSSDNMQDMPDYQSSEKNFSPDQDQKDLQKLALNQDQLIDFEELNTNLEELSPKDMTVPIKDKDEVLEKNMVSKLPDITKVSVNDIIQSSNIDLKSKKVSNLPTLEKAGEDILVESESTENEFVEKQISSTTMPSKNNEIMSKIFESSSFSHEQNKQFEELALHKDVSSHQGGTAFPEGQIIFKSENLDPKLTLSNTSTLTPMRQIEMEIRQAVHNGVHKLEFDLNPLELGKMNIRLSIDAEGHIKALVQAEKLETFELLQKDTTTRDIILKAFDEAGLIADGNSLQFSHQESNARNQSAGDFLMSFQNQDKEAVADEENSNLIYKSRTDPSRAYDIFV